MTKTAKTMDASDSQLTLPEILLLAVLLLISIVVSYLVKDQFASDLMLLLPQINGILVTGVLASLALAFTFFHSDDMETIHESDIHLKNYIQYCAALKLDAIVVLMSFMASIVVILLSEIDLISSVLRPWFWLAIGLFFLILAVFSIQEIISSLFTLNTIKISLVGAKKDNRR